MTVLVGGLLSVLNPLLLVVLLTGVSTLVAPCSFSNDTRPLRAA